MNSKNIEKINTNVNLLELTRDCLIDDSYKDIRCRKSSVGRTIILYDINFTNSSKLYKLINIYLNEEKWDCKLLNIDIRNNNAYLYFKTMNTNDFRTDYLNENKNDIIGILINAINIFINNKRVTEIISFNEDNLTHRDLGYEIKCSLHFENCIDNIVFPNKMFRQLDKLLLKYKLHVTAILREDKSLVILMR